MKIIIIGLFYRYVISSEARENPQSLYVCIRDVFSMFVFECRDVICLSKIGKQTSVQY